MSILNDYELASNYCIDNFIKKSKFIEDIQKFVEDHLNDDNSLIEYIYGHMLMEKQNFKEAFVYFKKSSDHKYSKAAWQLGVMYRDGLGVKTDNQAAQKYFTKAKSLGKKPFSFENKNSSYFDNLENMYQEGMKLLKSGQIDKSITLFESC